MMLTHKLLEQNPIGGALKDFVASAVQIDFGEVDDIPLGKSNEVALARPPFKDSIVQFSISGDSDVDCFIMFVEEIDDGELVIVFFQRGRDAGRFVGKFPIFVTRINGVFNFTKVGGGNLTAAETDAIHMMFWRAMNGFYAIGCSNVELSDNKPPAALNKKRAKAGKLPLFEYKTLVLKVGNGSAKSADCGGTHASPRVHLRRGHVRRIDETRRVWVQACVVGSKHGMVAKDYRVEVAA